MKAVYVQEGWTKVIARKILDHRLPNFPLPAGAWLRKEGRMLREGGGR